jgi:hypothetical protein
MYNIILAKGEVEKRGSNWGRGHVDVQSVAHPNS